MTKTTITIRDKDGERKEVLLGNAKISYLKSAEDKIGTILIDDTLRAGQPKGTVSIGRSLSSSLDIQCWLSGATIYGERGAEIATIDPGLIYLIANGDGSVELFA